MQDTKLQNQKLKLYVEHIKLNQQSQQNAIVEI